MTTTVTAGDLHEKCGNLFRAYPLAWDEPACGVRSMVLMQEGAPEFFILAEFSGKGTPRFRLLPWREEGAVSIEPGAAVPVPPRMARVVTSGIPLPRDGSLFGWVSDGRVCGLLKFRVRYSREQPVPRYSPMPLAALPESRWPAWVRCGLFGTWFWEGVRAGSITDLAPLIAATPRTVFWARTRTALGSDCAAVARDVAGKGIILPAGVYAYFGPQQDGAEIPSLETLLAGPGLTDLAPRFRGA